MGRFKAPLYPRTFQSIFEPFRFFQVDPQSTFNVHGIILLRKMNLKQQMYTAKIELVHLHVFSLARGAHKRTKLWDSTSINHLESI